MRQRHRPTWSGLEATTDDLKTRRAQGSGALHPLGPTCPRQRALADGSDGHPRLCEIYGQPTAGPGVDIQHQAAAVGSGLAILYRTSELELLALCPGAAGQSLQLDGERRLAQRQSCGLGQKAGGACGPDDLTVATGGRDSAGL
jgi:hypothetical protein